MPFELRPIDFRKLFGGFEDLKTLKAGPNGVEAHWEWPKELGQGYMDMIKVRPGLILGIAHYRLKQDIRGSFEHDHSLIDLGFSFSGDVPQQIVHEHGMADSYHYRYRHGIINCLPPCRGGSLMPSKVEMAYVRINAEPKVLKDMLCECTRYIPYPLQDILNGDTDIYYYRALALPPLCMTVVQQILNCPYRGQVRLLFLEGKVLELISHVMAHLFLPGAVPNNGIQSCEDDMAQVLKAEHLLIQRLENPPSLTELAKQVGLNKNKLNQGFHQQFGTSVFDHLRILRLERARALLQSGQSNVTEVAFNVGYKHHGNFTRAFKKHFGTTPHDLIA